MVPSQSSLHATPPICKPSRRHDVCKHPAGPPVQSSVLAVCYRPVQCQLLLDHCLRTMTDNSQARCRCRRP
jgi:hypothetical protein